MDMRRRLSAEAFGTFWLVIGGCGTAVLAGSRVGAHRVALAFGLTVVTMAYAVGGISGGHFNPAVTIGLVVAGRLDKKDAPAYIGAQVVGAILAAVILAAIASGVTAFEFGDAPADAAGLTAPGFASNGFGARSPGGYSFLAVVIAEVTMTAFFLIVILGATAKKAVAGFGGLDPPDHHPGIEHQREPRPLAQPSPFRGHRRARPGTGVPHRPIHRRRSRRIGVDHAAGRTRRDGTGRRRPAQHQLSRSPRTSWPAPRRGRLRTPAGWHRR